MQSNCRNFIIRDYLLHSRVACLGHFIFTIVIHVSQFTNVNTLNQNNYCLPTNITKPDLLQKKIHITGENIKHTSQSFAFVIHHYAIILR